MTKRTDLMVHGHGSIYLLRPISRRGRRWIDTQISADRIEWAGAIVVEPRYVADIVRGALDHGLTVR